MRRRSWATGLVVGTILGLAQPASAFDWDFLDYLSGPGRFSSGVVPRLYFRLGCVVRVEPIPTSETTAFSSLVFNPFSKGKVEEAQRKQANAEPIARAELQLKNATVAPSVPEAAPAQEFLALFDQSTKVRNSGKAAEACLKDERTQWAEVLGYFSVRWGYSQSTTNNLYVTAPTSDEYRVSLHLLEVAYSHRLNHFLDLTTGVGVGFFGGKAFDRFSKGWLSSSFDIAPIAILWPNPKHRALKLRVGTGAFFGHFTEEDFCRASDTCAQARDYKSKNFELLKRFSIEIDPFLLFGS